MRRNDIGRLQRNMDEKREAYDGQASPDEMNR